MSEPPVGPDTIRDEVLALGDEPPVEEWWWSVSEKERDMFAAMSASAAAASVDRERLFALWREGADSPPRREYVDDLVVRVLKHLEAGTGFRRVERAFHRRPPGRR